MSTARPPFNPPSGFEPAPAHLGWRLLAWLYDLMPVIAIWIGVSALAYALNGGERVEPGTVGAAMTFFTAWIVTGCYAVLSWRRGGHTLGMRPWRLQIRTPDGQLASAPGLWLRYVVATLGLAAFGLGLLWPLVDRQRRGWHDIAAGTVMLRRIAPPKAAKRKAGV